MRVMPGATSRVPSARRAGPSGRVRRARLGLRSLAARTWTGHRLFVIVLIPAVLLRADAELGYRWQAWFNDSFVYCRGHGSLQPRPDPRVGILGLPQDPGAVPQLRPYNDSATSHGPGRRGHDLRAGQAPLRRPRLAGHAGHRAGALRRVRDRARAPDPVRRAVPVRAHPGHHAAAVGPGRAVHPAQRGHRPAAGPGGGAALARGAAARAVRPLHDHQAVQLAEDRGHPRGGRWCPSSPTRGRSTWSTGSSR